jgi:hypothetical protein
MPILPQMDDEVLMVESINWTEFKCDLMLLPNLVQICKSLLTSVKVLVLEV